MQVNNSIFFSSLTIILTTLILSLVQLKVTPPMLLAERLFTNLGWLEVILLGFYSLWVFSRLDSSKDLQRTRRNLWLFFSVVFFSQLLLGVTVSDIFLMTGKLHLPIPGVIILGPIYRGEGFFMLILFISTIILVGPGWCSYLCYLGGWDLVCAMSKKRPATIKNRRVIQVAIFLVLLVIAFLLNIMGVNPITATILAIAFGIMGIGIMISLSKRFGLMIHCTTWCPIAFVATLLAKISPFRLRIRNQCDECWACYTRCKYSALEKEHIKRRKPGITCTLCGDCLRSCKNSFIEYSFLGLKPANARMLFLSLVSSLHAIFLGLARI